MPVLPGVFPSNVSKKLLMEAGDRRGEKKKKRKERHKTELQNTVSVNFD